jgi:hypothetical protein
MRANAGATAIASLVLVLVLSTSACSEPRPGGPSADDPLGCGLPATCAMTELRQGSQELQTQDAAVCQYQTIVAGKVAHMRVHFVDVTDITWDVYTNGVDPAVLVETECEINGPCSQKAVKRCTFQTPTLLDCSHGTGPARVCGAPIEWCGTSRDVDPTCP